MHARTLRSGSRWVVIGRVMETLAGCLGLQADALPSMSSRLPPNVPFSVDDASQRIASHDWVGWVDTGQPERPMTS
ncbi:hypothetical protein B0T20DRAFT_414574 [Sordaria brevicollis]|uniref:Uncharacterized protein n=1 Tax=Sordaria brevicollis TaxID=83679 RepID=A0AAE0UAB9_SORBR|nr:hypothetical protein B0T20DRAFT_414574 [Sordaria brevicollis]